MDIERINIEKDNDIIFFTVRQYKFFLAHDKIGMDALLLYCHLFFTARLQETNQVYAKNVYLKNGLKWGDKRLKAAKAFLKKHGIIDYKQDKDESGKYKETYLVFKRVLNSPGGSNHRPPGEPSYPSQETNAYNNNINALNKKKNKDIRSGLEKPDVLSISFLSNYNYDNKKKQYFIYIPKVDSIFCEKEDCKESPDYYDDTGILEAIEKLDFELLKEFSQCAYCHNILKSIYFLYKRMKEIEENEIDYEIIGDRVYLYIENQVST